MNNLDIRIAIFEAGLKHREVAEEMGVSRYWFSVLLRHELSRENWVRIMQAIARLKEKKGGYDF